MNLVVSLTITKIVSQKINDFFLLQIISKL